MPKRATPEQAEKVRLRHQQLTVRLKRIEAMLSEQGRKDDTRRKIILGGALLSYARNLSDPDAAVAARLIERARADLTLPSHKSVFADWGLDDEPFHG